MISKQSSKDDKKQADSATQKYVQVIDKLNAFAQAYNALNYDERVEYVAEYFKNTRV